MPNIYISKIKKSINNGLFLKQVAKKIHSFIPVYSIKNKNIRFQNEIAKTYIKYQKKYADFLLNGVEVEEQKKSDKVWICWFQGEDNAPELVKCCINSVRKAMPEKEIIILNDDNINKYAKFPEYIIQKRKKGRISAAHFSDLLRVELLCRYGGIWIDSTVYCTAEKTPDYVNEPFFVYKSLDLTGLDLNPNVCSSWFISSHSNNQILLLTRKLLWKYWEDKNYVDNYFLFHVFLALAVRRYPEIWNKMPTFDNHSPHILCNELNDIYTEKRWKQIINKSDFHKLSHHNEYSSDQNTIYNYIINNK